ncbi:hypothetical protein BACI71_60063 [Bacillus mycoides]|uniref:Uncharacterized protein n=1 Tax=Bacillus mycoides TaxID=1405 RepID=A0A654AU58_BACMY|nr:hypothetical protein [Bacillus mycoides]VXC70642.1 hypothetical protein BACI71_60063 [Bacillus mycoides]
MKIFVVKSVIEGENECVLMGAYPTLTEANKRVEELTKKYKQDKETRYTTEQTELTNF